MFQSITNLIPIIFIILFILSVFILIDLYSFQALKSINKNKKTRTIKFVKKIFWGACILFYVLFVLGMLQQLKDVNRLISMFIAFFGFGFLMFKLLITIPLLIEDFFRLITFIKKLVFKLFKKKTEDNSEKEEKLLISRKKFISQVGTGMGLVGLGSVFYAVSKGAHDYKVHHIDIFIKNLPKGFEGFKILQLSDIHCGSFWNFNSVESGIDLALSQNADMIVFTGDLVNSHADELSPEYQKLFSRLNSKHGVFSIFGNHDYGDYHIFKDKTYKKPEIYYNYDHMSPMQLENLNTLAKKQKDMGWDLMINEHRIIEHNGDKMTLIGIENFGTRGHFPRYGKMTKATENIEETPLKILLSHDPCHWNYEVTKKYNDIQLTLSGHTHGAQFGVETENFQWSPAKYVYKQWAGLYQNENQQLYVNRGFGYLGFPGRLGIRPEITILTLKGG